MIAPDRLQPFFLECARRSFHELGLRDPQIIEYVATVLTTFARADQLYRLRAPTGKRLENIVEMLSTAFSSAKESSLPLQRERELRKYVGDYALFMSGLFRTAIDRRGILNYYLQEGRRSYWKVSELDLALYQTGFLLFQELSKNFEYYSGALDYMRKAYFAPMPGEDPFSHFLRNVEGWMKVSLSDN